ncbi:MAG: hypothetical protein LH628_27300 [Microcoleus sp. CAN_BIN18]|nr:hypothetical protein [Microcoleus sp. CAN_BIN18]
MVAANAAVLLLGNLLCRQCYKLQLILASQIRSHSLIETATKLMAFEL